MEPVVLFAVLACAFVRALVDCSLKAAEDPLAASLALPVFGIVGGAGLLLAFGLPPMEAMPYALLSVGIAVFYWVYLGRALATGSFGLVFPLTEGLAPLAAAAFAFVILGETLSLREAVTVALVLGGLGLVAFPKFKLGDFAAPGVALNCLVVAMALGAYTFVDAVGARSSDALMSYTGMIFLLDGLNMLAVAMFRFRRRFVRHVRMNGAMALFWALASLAAYATMLWATTKAPIGLVASLVQTSILFAIAVSSIWLKEPLPPARIAGAALTCGGMAMLKFF